MKFELGEHAGGVERRIEQLTAAGAPAALWSRSPAFWGDDAARQASVANRLGWLDVASRMRDQVAELRAFGEDVRGQFDACVLVGMGGSSLAPEVLRQSIPHRSGWPLLYVLDTTDPATILGVTRKINPARTLFFVSSKSGTTLEPLSLFAYFQALVAEAKGDAAGDNFVAITDAGTPLQDLAREHRFRRVFTNPGDIGGRYSALSYFGLAPAAATGVDVARLLDSAKRAADAGRFAGSDALRLGAALGELARGGRDKCTFIATPAIAAFGLWVEQLIAESTGKLGTGIVPVAGEPLASPRHYADDRAFVRMRLEGGDNAELDAIAGALFGEGQPVITVDLDDPYDLGREFFRWEFAVAVAGRVLEINPFDEPNVQESKDNTRRVLADLARTQTLDVAGLGDAPVAVRAGAGAVDLDVEGSIAELLRQLAPGDYFAITAYVEADAAAHDAFEAVRRDVRDTWRVATTLGYGPRFLHSTGQLHKGGPAKGVFLQVTSSDLHDIAIPGQTYTFGQLKRAQAIGDLQALHDHGRPALRVHLGADMHAGLAMLRRAVASAVAGAGVRGG
ncbi:MAG: glucose-6-phosphate isomerase [Dehalococcoidia bacterium]|nr:glucose-6-phosphate isomerase [Dehalococcoidia bacterium]